MLVMFPVYHPIQVYYMKHSWKITIFYLLNILRCYKSYNKCSLVAPSFKEAKGL